MRLVIALCLLASPALALTDEELAAMKAKRDTLMLKIRQQQVVGMFGGIQDVPPCDPSDAACSIPRSEPQSPCGHEPPQLEDQAQAPCPEPISPTSPDW